MEDKQINVLLIEDNPGDARLVQEALSEEQNGPRYVLEWQQDMSSGLKRLDQDRFDVLLLDLGLPESGGLNTFLTISRLFQYIPIIVSTGLDDELLADQALAAGAQDYIVKGDIRGGILTRAIRYSIERKRSELDLRRVNAELEGYAHTVSHDLRSPLSAIAIACELLSDAKDQTHEELRAEVVEAVGSIKRNLMKSSNLIEDLLTLARAGHKPVEVARVNVLSILKLILQERSTDIEDRGVEVVADKDLGNVMGSNTHIYQLFSNLVSNAILHNENPQPVIEVRMLDEKPDGCKIYLVKDNGDPVDPADWNKYLMPFVKGRAGSTGIGLPIVKKIVELYGGELKIYDDSGTCFEFGLYDLVGEDSAVRSAQ